jgi:hypothetical protein
MKIEVYICCGDQVEVVSIYTEKERGKRERERERERERDHKNLTAFTLYLWSLYI